MRSPLIFPLLLTLSLCYLQLPLTRIPTASKDIDMKLADCQQSASKVPTNQNVDLQLCYLKDISYAVELYHDGELYMLAMDMTIPVSWIKAPECQAAGKTCGRVKNPISEKVRKGVKEVEEVVKETVKGRKGKKEAKGEERNQDLHTVLGMDLITGELEKSQNIEFWTKDSSKLTNFYKLLLVGLFLSQQKDKMLLTSTNFINATQITPHASHLSDGAISLRFDDSSQNSFLNQIFTYVGQPDKVITIYLSDNSTVTLGQLSIKNAQQGYSGITWLDLGSNKQLPLFDQLTIEQQDTEKISSVELSVEGVFTLSASYVSFPRRQLGELIKLLDARCEVLAKENLYVRCENGKKLMQKKLVYEIGEGRIALEMKELVLKSKGHSVLLNIRENDPDNPYLILGQPVFKKYFTVFHYTKGKIGIALKRVTMIETLFQVITLVRFLTFVFVTGCCFLICYRPIRRMVKTFRLYYKVNDFQAARDSDRQGLRYSNEDENPYSDIAGRLQELTADSGQGL